MPIRIGAQLFTVRELLQTPEGIEKTLARIADIGYEYVQCSGFAFDAAWLRALCGRLGLKIRLTHVRPGDRILNDTQNVIAEHKTLGCPYVGVGGMGKGYGGYSGMDGVRQFIKDFTPAMKALHDAGMKFQYHNHSGEFERRGGSETIFDVLVNESDPTLMGLTLDTYWAQLGGVDVVDLIRRLKGRIDVCHYKDFAVAGGQPRMAAVGSGNMNWPGMIAAFEEAGLQYAFVEQDDCYGADPLEELTSSFQFLRIM